MAADADREDLAASFTHLARYLSAAEEPLLTALELTMWEYVVLSRLAVEAAPNQLSLAVRVGYDKSRLVPLLDALQERGLVQRTRDPADRRSHAVSLTHAGRTLLHAARTEIHEMEDDVLAVLGANERRALRAALAKLRAHHVD